MDTKKISLKHFIIAVIILLILIQFIRIDKTNPPVIPDNDFITITNPPEEVAAIIRSSCYDCHSHQTVYPWYSNIAPVSWLIKNHVNEGRDHVNFSQWNQYPDDKARYILGECYEEIAKGKMPLFPYPLLHPDAKMNETKFNRLAQWYQVLKSGNRTNQADTTRSVNSE